MAYEVSLRAHGESRSSNLNFCFLFYRLALEKIVHTSPERGRDSRLASRTKESSTRAMATGWAETEGPRHERKPFSGDLQLYCRDPFLR
jgi:hypothetical protein